ncbi:nuclear transport factor 2 family protein [Pseudoalteromonas xiamenensis]|uniref:nuclear transport factor 2 family protein n=1 Tax=Pseudoalteromonas xiamenensis TaxID=882626 RepID=UPI0027E42879|nr:nuclear transport factor 2 family protein [Pseudoalteromonas xiamenensis]WMN58999.1 nuclear transport factor 2 family protein [Pseudoalteromonas xiamenensis]
MSDSIIEVVERQLRAYNEKDAQAWAATYAEDAMQLSTEGAVLARGREAIQANIAARFLEPDLKATVLSRETYGNVVIDHEHIVRNFPEGKGSVEMLCIYTVEGSFITHGIFKVFNKQLELN